MLRWEREDGRFYEVTVCRDLFGKWCVIKLFGGKKINSSKLVHIPFNSKDEAMELVAHIAKRRKQHKYKLVEDNLFSSSMPIIGTNHAECT